MTGMPGSLAAIGGQRTALLSRGQALISTGCGPLFGPGAALARSRAEWRQRAGSKAGGGGVNISEEALVELVMAPADIGEYPAAIPDAGRAPEDLYLGGEGPL
ncbi:MAG: hypothetical protein ACK5LJ_11595 [Paracoccus sp. (in: a-proteobacteria)]